MRNKIVAVVSWMLLMAAGVSAQTGNRLTVGDVVGGKGSTVLLDVSMENTAGIVAVEFTLDMPEGVTLITDKIMKTERLSSHIVSVREVEHHRYKFILMSPNNDVIKGNTGSLFAVAARIGSSLAVNSSWPMSVSDAVMSVNTGENVLTEATAGVVHISEIPGLVIKDVSVDKQAVTPGERIMASWQIMNTGDMPFEGGWSEQVSLVTEDKTVSKVLATMRYNDALSADGVVSRQTEILLPELLGIDGRCWVEVRMVPKVDAALATAKQSDLVTINKVLSIKLTPTNLEENAGGKVMLKMSRSGRWTMDETFNLTATADSRLSVPATITIPEGQSGTVVYLTVTDNDVVDDSSDVTLSVEGNDYPAAVAHLTIEDNEYPDLQLTASKSVIAEGETFQLTIMANHASSEPLNVTLNSENDKRFTYPRQVTIPAGQTSVTVDVTAKDDDLPSEALSNVFTASASRFNQGEVVVLLEDDDMPVLELTLTPNKIAESAGPVSVAGTLRRIGVTTNKITVRLSDDSNGGLYFGTRQFVLNKGVEEVNFNFGPIDNAQVDGDRIYTVTAAVWLSSCSCSATGESAGSVSATLEVFDDDGPALTLTSSLSTIKEGGKAILTVGHNNLVSLDQPLIVHLSSDYDDNLIYEHTVTIPAGQQIAQVEITSTKNDVSGDTHTAVFTAQAEGFASATCYLMITDQTLPDAVITGISLTESEMEAGGECIVTLTVANRGFAILPSQAPINLYLKEGNTLVGRMYTQNEVSPGETISVSKSIHFYSSVGYHSLYAIVNESHALQELQYTNNTSSTTMVHLLPSFSAIVEVENAVYQPNENVIISGVVSGKSIANAEVEVYLLNSGLRQIINTTTDEKGHFSISWKPLEKEVGHFIVGACAPGEESRDSLASFDVIGLLVAKKYSAIEVDAGAVVSDSLTVFNPCSLPLTSIRVETLGSSNLSIASQTIDRLEPGQSAHLSYSITGNEPTVGNDWQSVPINLICQEGGRTNHQLYCYVHTPRARLETNILEIRTTMVKGRVREYPITIKNTGRGASGRISVDTGSATWLSSSTANNIPSLGFGDSTTVVLQFTATNEMLTNNTMEGYIAINCENGVGCLVKLTVETVSEEMGSLTIDVWDEYTYFTEEAPHVAGANVRIMHPVTGQLLASSTTNSIGICTFTLPEGIYNISVDKENHESFLGSVIIDPGREKSMVITILLETIQVSLAFEETEVEDVYHITTTVEYETNVPTPVVVLNLPDTIPVSSMSCGESILIEAIVTNKGLIKAIDTYLEFPEIPGLKFTILENELFDLPAQQSILVPILVTRYCLESENNNSNNNNGGVIGGIINFDYPGALLSNIPCYIPVYVYYGVNCDERKYKKGYSKYLGLKPCPPIEITEVEHEVLPPPSGDGSGGGGSGETVIRSGNLPIVMPDCDYRYNNAHIYLGMFIECLVKGVYRNLPVFGPGINAALCVDDIEQCVRKKAMYTPECMQTVIECLHIKPSGKAMEFYEKGKQVASPIMSFDDCQQLLQQFKDSMEAVPPGTLLTARSEGKQHSILPDYIVVYQERINQIATALQGELDYMKEFFGNDAFLQSEVEEVLILLNYLRALPENTVIDKNAILPYKPDNISETSFFLFIDRLNNTCRIDNGEAINTDNYISEVRVIAAMDKIASARTYATTHGFTSLGEMFSLTVIDAEERYESQRENICAKITLQLEQTMTLTRPAIRGTLNVNNGHDSSQMTDIILNIIVKDEYGKIATEREFQIIVENLNGFVGSLDLTSGWTLASQQIGTAKVLLIPSKYAAPLEPKNYLFGGTLSYVDPFTGLRVTREFIPQKLTVNPSPDLELTYLMQRDVYGDDPLTTDKVEPMEEAEFALIINNKGNGEAKNVRMVTEQPKIVENEKGLFVDFDIVSSQVNGDPAVLSLGQTIANDFGNIGAHSQSYALWWLRSTLLGHFTSYEVAARHVSSYGNQDLSLVDTVTIHEMVHGFTPLDYEQQSMDNKKRGWLVNDIVDADDMPDVVYFSDATQQTLNMSTGAISKNNETEYKLTVNPSVQGWNYGSVIDPTKGKQKLAKIVRQSDGIELPIDNIWQTDRTLRDAHDWLYENRLHFVGDIPADGETFILTFEPKPKLELAVENFVGVPEENTVLKEQLTSVTVKFNKSIKAETFTTEDITLHCQGVKQDATQIIIEKQNEQEYKLILNEVTLGDGYYVLTVQTAGIEDQEGFCGTDGKQAAWIQYVDGKVALHVAASPAEGGTVSPVSGRFDYDSDVAMVATAAEGYDFMRWTNGSQTVSEQPAFSYHLTAETKLTAQFQLKHFEVTIDYDEAQGKVTGAGTGIYDYGTVLTLTAVAAEGYQFDGWLIDGEVAAEDVTLTLTVKDKTVVIPLFSELPTATLSGVVAAASNDMPISDATITLTCGETIFTTTTDLRGRYEIEVADKQLTYDVRCVADGYMDGPDISIDMNNGNRTKDFYLLRGATVRLPDDGICTFSATVPLRLPNAPNALTAYYAKTYTGESVSMGQAEGDIAVNEGLILVGTPNERIDLSEASTANAIEDNLLRGTAFEPYRVETSDIYVLANKTGETKFHKAAVGLTIPRKKAYLELDYPSQANALRIIWDESTLVEMIKANMSNVSDTSFDLLGRPTKDGSKGKKAIKVKKGKKTVMK